MKGALSLLLVFSCSLVIAQSSKGVRPEAPGHAGAGAALVTRAVVIGISDYQDPHVTDLHYADRDALIFADWLRSPAGGGLADYNLKVLINKQATAGNVVMAMDWLVDESRENDLAIIYFSGHGDVDKRTASQTGHLLCWDVPAGLYRAGGTYRLSDLQETVVWLSKDNKVRVLVITDACHAGKLAGSEIGGPQLTNTGLKTRYANEMKIMACQPSEYALEGVQWGGGRGAFSYHLVDGLYGMADANYDGNVSLLEIGRYLEDHVSAEVAPYRQMPLVDGERTETVAKVVPELLKLVQDGKSGQIKLLFPADNRGLEEMVLEGADPNLKARYQSFLDALAAKRFFEPGGAEVLYTGLMKEPALEPLYNHMTRHYAAVLQDDAQQAINAILQTNFAEINLSVADQLEKYSAYPRLLNRAAELLGQQHYMYKSLKAREYMFEGFFLYLRACLGIFLCIAS